MLFFYSCLGTVYCYDKSTSSCIAGHKLFPDPYESQRLVQAVINHVNLNLSNFALKVLPILRCLIFIWEVLLVPTLNVILLTLWQLLSQTKSWWSFCLSNSLYVGQSLISGAGEGLFAKSEAKANTVMAFYNGVRITHSEVCKFCTFLNTKWLKMLNIKKQILIVFL